MAFPEIMGSMWVKTEYIKAPENNWQQIKQGWHDFWANKWVSFRSGIIGGVIGMIPGIGGPIVDYLSYGQTIATNKNESIPFGEGNVKGVIGPEGANLAQKATAYVPTVLFGVPAAPFEAMVMMLLGSVGLQLGGNNVLHDQLFFNTLTFGFMASMFLTFFISIWFIRYATLITLVPFKYWGALVLALITWSCVQYTGGWEDYAILILATGVGFFCKYFKISRISFIIGFALSHQLELMTKQFTSLYQFSDLLHRPISIGILTLTAVSVIYGMFFNKTKLNYT
jgi:TctA family transporter